MMTIAMYPGSFDPVTNGHVDIIQRAAAIFDKVIVAVAVNSKKKPLFNEEERMELLRQSVRHISNVSVVKSEGLTVDFARKYDVKVLVRGLRAVSDFENEMQISGINRHIEPGIETIFITADSAYNFLSSSIVKEAASFRADISKLVPPPVQEAIKQKF
ncbi:pantetheine-phosphate adenylyltransferase [Terribacillus saccharophilus]|uniref:pantetheine-phosphate adenylyltransferase n=1 Tax=Terribacillus saccharophilus TaxID=361277 RepID=UPI000BA736CE|nr:pantetheine-phosphate adenylyltransferase [Terribacillus saccharophilus]PAF22042.1 pantetheine-phosphate adenylyltransferase [Terribacillus saccharophilus]